MTSGRGGDAGGLGAIADGRYELTRRLHRGAGHDTFRARDVLLDRVVTVVVHHATGEPVEAGWARHVRALGEIDHAHIAELCDGGHGDGDAFSVLRVAGARVLSEDAGRHAAPEQLARWCGDLAAGLGRLHAHGFTHGAVGADGVLLDDAGAACWYRLTRAVHDDPDPARRESDLDALRDLAAGLIGGPLGPTSAAQLDALLRDAAESSAWLFSGPDDVPSDQLSALIRRARCARWRFGRWSR